MVRFGTGNAVNRTLLGMDAELLVYTSSVVVQADRRETYHTVFFYVCNDESEFVHVGRQQDFFVTLALFHEELVVKIILKILIVITFHLLFYCRNDRSVYFIS